VQHFLWSLQCHRTSTAHAGSTAHQIMLIFSYQVSHKHISLAPTCFGHNQPSSEWLLFNDYQNHSILYNYIKYIKNTSVLIYVGIILVNLKLISKPVAHLLICTARWKNMLHNVQWHSFCDTYTANILHMNSFCYTEYIPNTH